MPEMPEIRAHAERLDGAVAGKTLTEFKIHKIPSLKTYDPQPKDLEGQVCNSVSARGKLLILDFDEVNVVIHLMQAGRLKIVDTDKAKKTKPALAHLKFETEEPAGLLFTEAGTERKAGIWLYSADPEQLPPLNKLGPDVDTLSLEEFSKILAAQKGRIHGVLRKQGLLAGLGRMLTNEILHKAKLSPFSNASKLSESEVKALHRSINKVVVTATAHEQTLDEIGSAKDRPSLVHNRIGEQCTTCEDDRVRSVEYNAYTVAYCATCQTGGKVLADNTTSKFLK